MRLDGRWRFSDPQTLALTQGAGYTVSENVAKQDVGVDWAGTARIADLARGKQWYLVVKVNGTKVSSANGASTLTIALMDHSAASLITGTELATKDVSCDATGHADGTDLWVYAIPQGLLAQTATDMFLGVAYKATTQDIAGDVEAYITDHLEALSP